MPKLLIYHNDEFDSEIELGGQTLRLGRGADNDVVLADPVKTLSRRHAQIVFERGTYTVVDQNSQNGIWAAGVRVPSAPLKSGAPVVMGAYKLLLKPDLVVSTGDETMLIPRGGLDLKAADPFATVFIAKTDIPPAGGSASAPAQPVVPPPPPGEATQIRPIVAPPKADAKPAAGEKAAEAAPVAKPAAPAAEAAAKADVKPPAAPAAPAKAEPAKAEPPKAEAKPAAAAAAAPKPEAKPAAAAAAAPAPPKPPAAPAPAPPAPAAAKAPEPPKPAAKAPEPAKPAAKKGDAGGSRMKYIAAAAVLLLAAGGGGYFMFGRTPAPAQQTAAVASEPVAAPAPVAKEPTPAPPEPVQPTPTPVAKAPVRTPKVTGEPKETSVKPVVKKEDPPPPPEPRVVVPPPPPPPDPQTLFEKARSAMIAGDYLSAVSGFEQVLKLDANYPNAANLLGVARGGAKNAAQLAIDAGNKLEMNGDFLGARKQYDRAGELDPGAPAVASAIRRLIARMQGAGEAAFKAARQYDATSKTKEAIASYESALQLLPANHESVPVARERLAALKGGA